MQTQKSNTYHYAIMEAGSKDRPPMLAPGNYVQWKSRIKRYIDTKPNHDLIHHCLKNPSYKFTWADKEVLISKGSPVTRTESYMETYKTISQDIRDQLNAEAEAVQIILTWIDNDIYSTVDACPNACKMWKAIERLKHGESINVQDLETKLYWEFRKFTSHDGESLESYYSRFYKMMNELIRNQFYNPQHHPTHYTQNSSTRSQQAATKNKGKAIVNSPQTIYDQEPSMVAEDDETSKDKEIDTLMTLISLSFKKIYKPTNNNLRTSSNTSRANQDNSLRINRSTGYENQRISNVVGARETVGSTVVQKSGIQCYNRKEFGHVAREYAADSGTIVDTEPVQKVSTDDYYNVFAIESAHPKQSESIHDTYPIEQDEHNKSKAELARRNNVEYASKVEIDCAKSRGDLISYKMESQKSFNKYTQTINDLNHTVSEMKEKLCAHQETISILSQQKETQIKLYKTRDDKELDKVIALENKVKVLDNIVYKTGQSVQTMNILNNKCRTSFAKPEFLKKAQIANPRLYDIGCYNDNLALMLAPESDKVIRLEKESRSKLSDLIRPFDYDKLNNLYDLFVPQHEKSVEHCKETISKRTYFGHIDTFIKNTIEANFSQAIRRINAGLEQFHVCLNEEMVADLRYFNSLKLEVDSLRSQLETQKTQFLNEIDRLSREYYYADHMNAILGVYTELDEVTNLQCGYLELLEKYKWKPKSEKENVNLKLVEIFLFIVDSRVYYVEGLNHNLFSVGQFCDADLEVAFRKSTCYIRDLKGNDVLTGSRGTDMYSIILQDTNSPNPICLMAKATSSQAWLWHCHLSHSNFDTINLLSKNDIVDSFLRSKDETPEVLIDFLRLFQRGHQAQVRIVQTDKGTGFLNQALHVYFAAEGILHQTSVARTPEQNGVVKRGNCNTPKLARSGILGSGRATS
nr:integrase, catalytic region, zinc finger, CCHC-type, peptidase aspartic, catalytic [Tanacetum cinerariifolium]